MDRQLKLDLVSNETLITSEVAQLLGVTSAAVSQWIQDGLFPNAYKVNPTRPKSPWRIPRADVDAFLQQRRTQRGYVYTTTPIVT